MVAEIYPLQRLPRRFRAFDYLLPEGTALVRGAFVEIRFRGRPCIGIVAKTKEAADAGITAKPIDGIRDESITARELDVYERLSEALIQSPSSVLYAALPTPPKRAGAIRKQVTSGSLRIPSSDVPEISEAIRFIRDNSACFVRVPDLRFAAAVISGSRRATPGAVRVTTPNVRDAELLHRALGGERLTGTETNNERFAAWSSFRAAKNGLLIGTRIVSMLEHPDGSTLFLVRSGHENLHQPDRNPRYDARAVARTWAAAGGRIVFLDVVPRPEDLFHFRDDMLCKPFDPQPEVIEMKGRQTWTHPFLSPQLIEHLSASTGRVLLAFNRKGSARMIVCEDCKDTLPYESTPPATCPNCHGTRLKKKGYGTAAIAKALRILFPDRTVALCEKGEPPSDADVLVATRHYIENVFDPFRPPAFSFVADLDADAAFADKSFRATEQAVRSAAEWHGVARAAKAPFALQTASPELFRTAFADPLKVMSEDLESRRAYGLPPIGKLILVDGVETPISGEIPDALRNAPDSVIIDTMAFS